jgi:hypothetical protein
MIFLDLDDFAEDNTRWDMLSWLRSQIPEFKVTLFTIPGLCSQDFIERTQLVEWVDLVPHGWMHTTPRECEKWTYEQTAEYLSRLEPLCMTRGWKAPGWQISDGTYRALLERGYWVADQAYNNERRPAGLRTYLLDSNTKIHGHIGHIGGHNANELEYLLPQLMGLKDQTFGFVKDCV